MKIKSVKIKSVKGIKTGMIFEMPEPQEKFDDSWEHGGFSAMVERIRDGLGGQVYATMMDADGDCFDIEIERLVGLETLESNS